MRKIMIDQQISKNVLDVIDECQYWRIRFGGV